MVAMATHFKDALCLLRPRRSQTVLAYTCGSKNADTHVKMFRYLIPLQVYYWLILYKVEITKNRHQVIKNKNTKRATGTFFGIQNPKYLGNVLYFKFVFSFRAKYILLEQKP